MTGRPRAAIDGIVIAARTITSDADRQVDVEAQRQDRWSVNSPPSSGPITVVTPKTAPSAPWYLPRSRSGMTSAISAVAVTIRPPAPMPWTARQRDQPGHAAASPHSAEADDEDRRAELEDQLAAEQVAELAGEHRRDRVGQQVRRDHPGHVPGAAEVADDGRQRRGDDRLVERRQQHPEQDRDEHEVDPAPVQRLLGGRWAAPPGRPCAPPGPGAAAKGALSSPITIGRSSARPAEERARSESAVSTPSSSRTRGTTWVP